MRPLNQYSAVAAVDTVVCVAEWFKRSPDISGPGFESQDPWYSHAGGDLFLCFARAVYVCSSCQLYVSVVYCVHLHWACVR